MKVVPSGTLLALLDPAIEFVSELTEFPTWRASSRCLRQACSGILLAVGFVGRGRLL